MEFGYEVLILDTPLSEVDVLEQLDITEDAALEAKKATGRSGNGELPQSFFESYSAMANTSGGVILLGVAESNKVFTPVGIKDTQSVLKQLWDNLNNKQIVSANILTNSMVSVEAFGGCNVIVVHVPRAHRQQRPVYVGENPLTGTYRRNHEGDFKCDGATVQRMLAEQIEETLDARILAGFGMNDIEATAFAAYRQAFKATKPDHPWLQHDDLELLRCLGGFSTHRETGVTGLTLAGLLMFGKMRSILDAVPNFVLDYQERAEPKAGPRWVDRITLDGSWSGNLYDFYRLVINKLTADLKIPFRLEGTQRRDDTPVHEALREALVNTLIHAEYGGRVGILVVKRPDLFGFRNPGIMRLPIEDALNGGISDCRNRNLQKMFQLVGLGEQAGSGIPKIWHNWKEQWRSPELLDFIEPDQTQLALRMVSLLPDEVFDSLRKRYGSKFNALSEIQRLALATVAIEGKVTHGRLKSISTEHSRDITTGLASLVRQHMLESDGNARGTYYFFPGEKPTETEDFRLGADSSEHLGSDSEHLAGDSEHLALNSERMSRLAALAEPVKTTSKVNREVMEQTIAALCADGFLTLRELSALLDRTADTLRIHYLNAMVGRGALVYKYPDRPNHPQQAYCAAPGQNVPERAP